MARFFLHHRTRLSPPPKYKYIPLCPEYLWYLVGVYMNTQTVLTPPNQVVYTYPHSPCLTAGPDVCFCPGRKQFTLNGRVCSKGKVDFTGSMPPAEARVFYEGFLDMMKAAHSSPTLVKDGVFGAKMGVALVNDGPITVTVDSSERREGAAAPAPSSEGREGSRGERNI